MRLFLPFLTALATLTGYVVAASECIRYAGGVDWNPERITLKGQDVGLAKSWKASRVKIHDPRRNVNDHYTLRFSITEDKAIGISAIHSPRGKGRFRQFLFVVSFGGGTAYQYWKNSNDTEVCRLENVGYGKDDIVSIVAFYRE